MVELQPILKKAYWALAASGLLYVLFICSLTFPEVQRLYILTDHGICREIADVDTVLSTLTSLIQATGKI